MKLKSIIALTTVSAVLSCKLNNNNHEYIINGKTGCITKNEDYQGYDNGIETICIGAVYSGYIKTCDDQERPQESTSPSDVPSNNPSKSPTGQPTMLPSVRPTKRPTLKPTSEPSYNPIKSDNPSQLPTYIVTETICT
jgi:hypothetical protein